MYHASRVVTVRIEVSRSRMLWQLVRTFLRELLVSELREMKAAMGLTGR